VSRIMAGLPEVMETPVLAKRKVQLKIVGHPRGAEGPTQEGGQATETAQGPSGQRWDMAPKQQTLAGLCFSPTVFLAPTPANTPAVGVPSGSQRQARRTSASTVDAVCASLHASAASRATSDATAAAAATAVTGAGTGAVTAGEGQVQGQARAEGSGPLLPARKPPMPRPSRGTPKASARLAALRIATPIGKTPPRACNANENDPARLQAEVSSPFDSAAKKGFPCNLKEEQEWQAAQLVLNVNQSDNWAVQGTAKRDCDHAKVQGTSLAFQQAAWRLGA